MRSIIPILLTAMLLLGCNQKVVPNRSSSTNEVAVPFEGKYYIVGNPECTVVMSSGFYGGATPYNLAGDVDGSGHYTPKQIGSNVWELVMIDRPWVLLVRADGGSVWLRGKDFANEVELRKK
jgi:hypothetical protein